MVVVMCNDCGKIFKKKIGPKTYEVVCPKCNSTDTEIK
jgi:Zn finger protein HypA/HybF involved in hydrogenase expression